MCERERERERELFSSRVSEEGLVVVVVRLVQHRAVSEDGIRRYNNSTVERRRRGFESRPERQNNDLLQGQLSVLSLIHI